MSKILLSILVFLILLLVSTRLTLARSGCCSHHGGVRNDGCGCNDGTPLSETCAPYYTCTANTNPTNSTVIPRIDQTTTQPVYTSIPTAIPTPTNTPTPTTEPTSTPTPEVKGTSIQPTPPVDRADASSGSFIPGLFGLGVLGGLGYLVWKRIKHKGKKNTSSGVTQNETTTE